MSESSEESSSSDGSHRFHNSQSHSLPYEIGSIYYINDIDGTNNNTEQIFADLVDDKGIKFTVKVDHGAQVNVLPRCIFEKPGVTYLNFNKVRLHKRDTVGPISVT